MEHTEGFLKLVTEVKPRVREITVTQAKERVDSGDKVIFVDVREDNEWDAEHATGAIHLGRGIIERDIETRVPDKDTEIILYCGGGYRSALATDNLQKMNYTNVYSMAGGWTAWKEAHMPTES